MFGAQVIHVYECQPSIYAENENIPYQFQPFNLELFLPYPVYLGLGEELFVYLHLVKLDSCKRILCQPLVGNGKVYHFLEAFHVPDNGVLRAMFLRL